MDSIIVASFADYTHAIDGYTSLKVLNDSGDIFIYRAVLIARDANGEYSVMDGQDNQTGLPTIAGTSLGALIGSFAGPVGLVVGSISGTLAGGLGDIESVDISSDFLEKVKGKMDRGGYAIVAEVAESEPMMLNPLLELRGATVYRTTVDEQYARYENEQLAAIDKDITDTQKQIDSAVAEDKATLQSELSHLQAKREAKKREVDAKIKETKKRWSQKRKSFREKVFSAGPKAREKFEVWAAANL